MRDAWSMMLPVLGLSCLVENARWDRPVASTTLDETTTATTTTTEPTTTEPTTTEATETSDTTPADATGGGTDPGGSTTSVTEGDPYVVAVLANNPVAYWRLGDEEPPVAADEVGTNPGTYLGAVLPRQPGLVVGEDTAVHFPGSSTAHVRVGDVFGFVCRSHQRTHTPTSDGDAAVVAACIVDLVDQQRMARTVEAARCSVSSLRHRSVLAMVDVGGYPGPSGVAMRCGLSLSLS